MVKGKLTEAEVRSAKPKEKVYILGDGDGLHLTVLPAGGKYWHLRYWVNNKETRVSLGVYPEVTLKDARETRDTFKSKLAKGIDPRAPEPEIMTFEKVALEWHEKKVAMKTEKYAHKVLSILRRLIFPFKDRRCISIGERSIRELKAEELLEALRTIEARGLNDTATTALQICGQIYRYAIASGYADYDIAASLRGALAPVVVKHNASITDPKKVRELMRAINDFSSSVIVKSALLFSAYTFQRPGEIRHMEWTEVNFEDHEWRIIAEKMKMRRQHLIPLSNQAFGILEYLKPITGHGKYVFPSIRSASGTVPMSENTISAALQRLGFGREEMSPHGFRSMASTLLHEKGWSPDAIERQLAHVEGNSVKAAYNYAEYLPERRKMMQWWADWLDSLVDDQKISEESQPLTKPSILSA